MDNWISRAWYRAVDFVEDKVEAYPRASATVIVVVVIVIGILALI